MQVTDPESGGGLSHLKKEPARRLGRSIVEPGAGGDGGVSMTRVIDMASNGWRPSGHISKAICPGCGLALGHPGLPASHQTT